MAALAVWILRLDPRGRFHQAASLLLVARGGSNVASGLIHPDSYSRLVTPYDPLFLLLIVSELMIPGAIVYFAVSYHAYRRGTTPRDWSGWALTAATAAMLIVFLADPGMFHLQADTDRPVYLVFGTKWLLYAATAALVLVQAKAAARASDAWPLILVGLGLGLNAAFQGGLSLARLLRPGPDWSLPFNTSGSIPEAAAGILLLGVIPLLARRPRAQRGPAATLAVAYASGFVAVVIPLTIGPNGRAGYTQLADGLWALAMPLLFAHAIVRHSMFVGARRARTTMNGTTLAAIGLAVFFVVTQLVQNFFTEQFHWAFGAVATGLLLFALSPIQRLAERISEGPASGQKRDAALALEERVAIYQDPVRLPWRDGILSREERRLLDALRDRLGLTRDQASAAEETVTQ